MAILASYNIFILLLAISFVRSEEATDCPKKCVCFDTNINCSELGLVTIPQNVTNPGNFTLLNVCMNDLISVRVLDLKPFKNLQTVDLSKNRINLVEDGAFVQLPYLEYLDLSDNMLTSLPDYSFRALSNLKSLVLGHNRLVSPGKALNGIPGILTINLEGNLLEKLSQDVFDGSPLVAEIDLSSNKLVDFPTAAVERPPVLRTVVVSGNQISKLGECALGRLQALETLQLERNLISSISERVFWSNCSNSSNSSGVDPNLQSTSKLSLKAIDLAGNLLTSIPYTQLSLLTHLRTLNLNTNSFTSIKRGTFQHMHSLLFISVSFSPRLQSVENGSFVSLHSLLSVFLHDCPLLNNFSSAIFESTPNLKTLKLQNNGFRSVSKELLKWGENITMTLAGNPIQCDCHLQWISYFYLNASTTNRSKLNLEGVKCVYPENVKGLGITILHPDQFHCPQRFKSIHSRLNTAVVVASVCGVVGLLVLLFVKFRNRICIFVRRQFRYKAHRDNRELFSVKLSDIMIENEPEPFYDDTTKLDLRPFRGHDDR